MKPTSDFLELIDSEKRGEMMREDIKRVLDTKYRIKTIKNEVASL
jgi:hypothetical protein